jgi:hypothetical protein
MGLLPNVLRPLFQNHFALFWHPFMTILFLALLIRFVCRPAVSVAEPRPQPA